MTDDLSRTSERKEISLTLTHGSYSVAVKTKNPTSIIRYDVKSNGVKQ